MPLSQDSIIQINSGDFSGSSGSVTLPASTTPGNMVVVLASGTATGASDGTPTDLGITGFEKTGFADSDSWQNPFVFTKVNVGVESSWTLTVTVNGPQQVVWVALEVEGVDPEVYAITTGLAGVYLNITASSVYSLVASQTLTSSESGSYEALGIALHSASAAAGAIPTISGHTDNWQEIASPSRTNGTRGIRMSVSVRAYQSIGPLNVTASISPSSPTNSVMIVLNGVTAREAPIARAMCGFEFGTATTLTQIGSSGDLPVFDEVVGTPEVVSTFKRSGTYSLKLTASAATESVTWIGGFDKNLDDGFSPAEAANPSFAIYFDGALPGVDIELASIEAASVAANSVKVWYRTATQKIGVKVGTGTEVVSNAVVAFNKWIGIELLYDPRITTHKCDWEIDYDSLDATAPVRQTQATNTGMTAGSITRFRLGWQTSTTATVYYDDVFISSVRKAFPMGLVNIRPLRPDSGGTATTTGTSANFQVFTSNGGTLVAFTSAGAISAVDEIPPVIGASADGVAQITANASNLCKIPMETYAMAANNVVGRGIRMYSLGWAASTSAASLQVQANDGVTVNPMGGDAIDAGFDNSGYRWMTKTLRPGASVPYVVTQAKLDALAIEFGNAGDATPDVGIHWALAELATQPAVAYSALEIEDGSFSAYVYQDVMSQSMVSVLVTTPAGVRGATLTYTIDGVDGSQYVGPNTVASKEIGATDISQVTALGLVPDNA